MTRRGNISVDLSALLRERAPSLPNFLARGMGRSWKNEASPPLTPEQFQDTVRVVLQKHRGEYPEWPEVAE